MCLFCLSDKIAKNSPLYQWNLQLGIISPSANVSIHYYTNMTYFYCLSFALSTCIILHALSFFPGISNQAIFIIRSIALLLMHDLSLMSFRNYFPCTCAWTYVCMPIGWHEESRYISYNRIFFKTKLSKYRTLNHIHPLNILYLSLVSFFVEKLSVDDYQKMNFQQLTLMWTLKTKTA